MWSLPRYRRILTAESVTIAHGTVCWGTAPISPNSTCTHNGLDAILHRAPAHFYPDIKERGLALVWNPTSTHISTTLQAPLYYAGLSTARSVTTVMVSEQEGAAQAVALTGDDTIPLTVSLGPRELTWFVITEQES